MPGLAAAAPLSAKLRLAHCTVSKVVVECCKGPADVPVTVMVYAPAGVPLLPLPPLLLLPPPQAARNAIPATTRHPRTNVRLFPSSLGFDRKPARVTTNPISGNPTA
jgi:hypothetical protein